ncbi:MAG TPA: GGDEF domain-containing protein [Noviherbaspirillum sp.]|nr:GGDEF domain-containing protein [Noviherbaspirillum sp.]
MKFHTSLVFQRLFPFIRFLIPPDMRGKFSEMPRAENLVVSSVLAAMVLPAYGWLYLALEDGRGALYCFLALSGVAAALAFLRLGGSTAMARETLAATIFALLLSLIHCTGGVMSPSVIWLSVCPLITTAAGGGRAGIRWTGFVLLALIGIYAGDLQDVFPPPAVTDMRLLWFVSTVSFILVVAIFLLVYERISSTAISGLNRALAIIHSQAIHDDLTGVFNRRELLRVAEREKCRDDRHGRSFCLCLIDVDHFKRINDACGHAVGDQVLKRIAVTIQAEIRGTDCFGRYGGEEFLMILTETDASAANAFAERIRATVEAMSFPELDGSRATISVGIAQHLEHETIGQTLARADRSLYHAKHTGRNRVSMASATLEDAQAG